MKINFKKVSAIAASALMVGMTMGTAVAANYPAPFISGGAASVAVVYGTGTGVSSSDLVQAGNVQSNLQSYMTGSTTTSASVTGEATELTNLYINDSINLNKDTLTKSHLANVLGDGSFSGNVDATFTQKIQVGSNPKVTFAKQPTSSDDPVLALTLSTTQANYIYNATVTFNKAINFTHADSEGEALEIFGTSFTIGSATDTTSLVLLKSAEKLDLSSDAATGDVTIAGKAYTLELVSASDTSATIKVTDQAAGTSESKEVNEAASKKINGITIAVTNADENNLKYSASVIAGSEKVTLTDASGVEVGEDDTTVDGTLVDFTGTTEALTALTISVYAGDSDLDAVLPGEFFIDPVYGTFKVDFSGFNIDSKVGTETTDRETISFSSTTDDKETIKFTNHDGYEKSVQFAKNQTTTGLELQGSDNGNNITVFEKEVFHHGDFVVVGNEDDGYLLELVEAKNQSGGVTGDAVTFEDVFSGTKYETTLVDAGTGTVDIGGKSYAVTIQGDAGLASETYNVSLQYPDSTGTATAILYPTIETSKGAKIAFYEPKTISLTNWTGGANELTTLKLPDGDGYTDVTFALTGIGGNFSVNNVNVTAVAPSKIVTIGPLTYNFTWSAANETKIYLQDVAGTSDITTPAIVIFEEKDDNSVYNALIVELEDGATSDDGLGIATAEDTWSNALSAWTSSRYSDSKMTDKMDLYGSIVTVESSDSDQKTATISYPDDQVYPILYIAEESAVINAGTTTVGGQLGDILVEDSEVSSVSSKNLIVVGGSCINSVAAHLLGAADCGASFTEKTGIGSGQFLIQGFADAYTTGKLALLVAGYDAADTVNAVTYLKTKPVDTTKKYRGTSSTTAELVTTTA